MEGIRDLSSYFRALKKQLACPKSEQARFLTEAKQMADDYRQGNLSAAEKDVIEFLGPPEELAAVFLESIDREVLQAYRNKHKWFRRSIIFAAALSICLLATWCVYLKNQPPTVEVTETLTIIVHEEVES